MSLFQEPSSIAPTPPPTRYRAVEPLAVMSTIFAALSILTAMNWWMALIPFTGIVLGLKSRRRILDAPDVYAGLWLAKLAIWPSVVLWILGYTWLALAKVSEVPYGYEQIKYETLQPDPNTPTQPIPESARLMEDKKVFVKGFMQPRRQQVHIKEFIICPTKGRCPFCTPKPKPTEMIRVRLGGDLETNYTTHEVGIAGRFHVEPGDPSGIPYVIKAEIIR